MINIHIVVVVVLLVVSGTCLSEDASKNNDETLPQATKDSIDAFINKLLTCRPIVGMNVAVVRGNSVLYTQGYGVSDMQKKTPVTDRTMFGIASTTKAFAATLLGQMLEDNSLSWDTPVREVLGEDFYFYDGLRTNQTTMRDLAAHRLGIPNNNRFRLQDGLTREKLAKLIRFFRPTEEFRGSHLYSNMMYGLMSYITEILGKKSWEELTTERIFRPLGMRNTTFTHTTDLSREDIAKPYLPDKDNNGTYRPVSLEFHNAWGELGGSGSIFSNAVDMAQWLRMQVNEGKGADGNQVISEKVLAETHQTVSIIPEGSSTRPISKPTMPVSYENGMYCLGWRKGLYRGNTMILHTGTSWGYGALATLLPDMDIGIYTSVTGPDNSYVGRRLTHMYIIDLLLGENPWLNLTTACTFPEPWTKASAAGPDQTKYTGTKATKPLTDYTGVYGNFGYGNISIELPTGSSHLVMKYGPMGHWTLYPTGENTFEGKGEGLIWMAPVSSVTFSTSSTGVIDKMITAFERRDPPVFIRGLKMSEAPPPPSPENCGTGSQTSLATNIYSVRYHMLTLMAFACWFTSL